MSTPNIDFQERFRQNNGILIGDFAHHSNRNFGNQQNWNMAPPLHVPVMEAGSQQRNISPDRSSSSIMSRFESPASAFYATEKYMGFPEYDCQVSIPSLCSQYTQSCDSHIPLHPYPGGNHSINSGSEQDGHSFGVRTTAQTIIKPHFGGNHFYKGLKISSSQQQNKFVPFQGNQENRVGCNPCSSPFAELGFCSRQEKQSPRFSSSKALPTSLSSKTRIRWTQDLHEKFVGCVNRLGGAEKATPKAILKLMDSDGLTIFHVKSHLQKYRLAKYMPDSSEGKAEKRTSINDVSQLHVKTGFQIREALQLQLDVQRRLHEQLEIQRNLQLRIQEQGKQLKMMFDQQQKTTNCLLNNQNLDITSPDEPTFSLEDIDVSIAEDSDNNTHFPSKIS